MLFNIAIYCFLDCFKSLVFFGLTTRNVCCKYCLLIYSYIYIYVTGEICYGINMLIHMWTETAHGEHRRQTSIYRDTYVRVVRFQKSVSGKHISLTAFRGKHGSLYRDNMCAKKHASLGICVRETRYPGKHMSL